MSTIKPWKWAVRETVGNMWVACDSELEAQETAAEWRVDGFEAEVVPLYDPAGVAADVAAERERCAALLAVSRADVSLAVGEMTAGEWRTCSAVLQVLRNRMRQT
jgi:hypothetical protein